MAFHCLPQSPPDHVLFFPGEAPGTAERGQMHVRPKKWCGWCGCRVRVHLSHILINEFEFEGDGGSGSFRPPAATFSTSSAGSGNSFVPQEPPQEAGFSNPVTLNYVESMGLPASANLKNHFQAQLTSIAMKNFRSAIPASLQATHGALPNHRFSFIAHGLNTRDRQKQIGEEWKEVLIIKSSTG